MLASMPEQTHLNLDLPATFQEKVSDYAKAQIEVVLAHFKETYGATGANTMSIFAPNYDTLVKELGDWKPSDEEILKALQDAHDIILTKGWTQKVSGMGSNGERCMVTAVNDAAKMQYGDDSTLESMRQSRLRAAVLDLLVDTLAIDVDRWGHGDIPRWNDHPGRTLDEVLDTFRKSQKKIANDNHEEL